MNEGKAPGWDPRSTAVLDDQIAAYDALRRRCPVAHSEVLNWSLFRHADLLEVLHDAQTFSNAVSGHLSVPNGMDPPRHTRYRRIIEPYFSPARMNAFAPVCRRIAGGLVNQLPSGGGVEFMDDFAHPFALQIQCAFMGWPSEYHEPLRRWLVRNHRATREGDRQAMAEVAFEFDGYIRQLLATRREAGAAAPDDPTTRLMHERVEGRPLSDDEIISIVRNWTVGELGTIAASVGILGHYLAAHPALQQRLREQPDRLPAAIDEILRIHAPLIANRRITTRPVDIAGRSFAAGERLTLIWASANRDEAVFGDPDAFSLDRDPQQNLLYGAGIHVCPGAPLARLELTTVMTALLKQTRQLALIPAREPVRAVYPAGGFSVLPLWVA